MGEMYGHSWGSQQGDTPNDTWIRGLEGVSNEQLAVGLRSCLDRHGDFPPSLPEFRQVCTGHDPCAWERQSHKTYDQSQLLEDKTGNERKLEERKSALAKMREDVGL